MKKKPRNQMRRQVRQDVRAAYKPVLAALRNERQGLAREEEAELGRVGNIYSSLAQSLGGMLPQNAQANQGILQGVQGALGSITGQGMDPAMAKALSTMGAGFAANLGSQALASQSGIASGIAAGGMQGADAEARIIERYKQHLNDITSQMHGVRGDKAQTFLQQLQAAKEFQLAQKEQQLRAEQFEKEFGFKKRQTNKANKKDEEALDFVLNQVQQEALDTKRKKWRKQMGIPELQASIADTRARLTNALDAQEGSMLRAQLEELETELRRKRRSLKKKTRRYKKKVSS